MVAIGAIRGSYLRICRVRRRGSAGGAGMIAPGVEQAQERATSECATRKAETMYKGEGGEVQVQAPGSRLIS